MIKIKLDDLMHERRVRFLSDLARATGISRKTLNDLRNHPDEMTGIRFETLDRLCAILDCGVADLLEYVPGGRKKGSSSKTVAEQADIEFR